jgi:tetratricopeptide (TPR) repeat protein
MTTVGTAVDIYWGIGGEYGPFKEQQTGEWAGWPDFGQVMRYFREKAKFTPQEFAEMYQRSVTTDSHPIGERQVRRMELENQVPVNMNRRKLIARLLNIPPMLFGLATLEHVTLRPHPEEAGAALATGHTTLPKVVADTTTYQNNIRILVTMHYTSQIQGALDQINADIRDLDSLDSQARGDLQYHIRELLFSYHLLAAKVVRDQRNFRLSYYYANHAVRIAKATNDIDLIATALYTRGRTYLQWGRCGTLENGVFQVQPDKINKAIRDFEDAKKLVEGTEKMLHPQVVGLIDVHLSRAYAIRNLSQGKEVPALVFTLLEDAEEKADSQSITDPYERHLVTGSLTGFVKGEYHNNNAVALTIIGKPGAALEEIERLEGLRQGAIGKDLTRKQIWLDIVTADSYMGLGRFKEAAERAKRALISSRDINSVSNLAYVVDIHGRLLQTPYKDKPDVDELGDMLTETLTAGTEQDE